MKNMIVEYLSWHFNSADSDNSDNWGKMNGLPFFNKIYLSRDNISNPKGSGFYSHIDSLGWLSGDLDSRAESDFKGSFVLSFTKQFFEFEEDLLLFLLWI